MSAAQQPIDDDPDCAVITVPLAADNYQRRSDDDSRRGAWMLTRRELMWTGPASAVLPRAFGQTSRYSHRLPASDQNYARSSSYIENVPIPEYRWASDAAYQRFQDMKYGVAFTGGCTPSSSSAVSSGRF